MDRPRRTVLRKAVGRSLLAAGAFVGLLGLAEGSLRLAGFERRRPPFVLFHPEGEAIEATILARPEVETGEAFLWRVRPNRTFSLEDGVLYRVNPSGFRGPEPSLPKRAGARRIVVLGESVAFGLGMPEEGAFASRIPEFLGAPAGSVEVLNGGIPGYTSYQGRLLLETVAAGWEPDAVVLYFGASNEFHRSVLTDRERGRGRRGIGRWLGRLRVLQAIATLAPPPAFEPRTVRVPLAEFEDDLGRMATVAREAGALPLLVVPPVSPACARVFPVVRDYQDAVRRASARGTIPLADPVPAFEAREDPGSLFFDLPHPNFEGHELLARTVAAALLEAAF